MDSYHDGSDKILDRRVRLRLRMHHHPSNTSLECERQPFCTALCRRCIVSYQLGSHRACACPPPLSCHLLLRRSRSFAVSSCESQCPSETVTAMVCGRHERGACPMCRAPKTCSCASARLSVICAPPSAWSPSFHPCLALSASIAQRAYARAVLPTARALPGPCALCTLCGTRLGRFRPHLLLGIGRALCRRAS